MKNLKIPYQLPEWKRAVIKVGSALIAPGNNFSSMKYMLAIANFVNECLKQEKEIVIVSSGAAASGRAMQKNIPKNIPVSIPRKQAFAALGQIQMMQKWSGLFDVPCAQILITHDDINNRRRYVNAKNAMKELLKLKALPIVNENDTVVVQELKVGDNDNLAAHVADIVEADLLVLCSDIDGLYTKNPKIYADAEKITIVDQINDEIRLMAGISDNPVATGGMRTKIEAAEKAVSRGIDVIIVNGTRQETFIELLQGNLPGTLFKKYSNPKAAKKHWIDHGIKCEGTLFVDSGAKNAIIKKSASLLPSGIRSLEGVFSQGDAVKIVYREDGQEQEIGKGIVQYSSFELEKIKGKHSDEIEPILGFFSCKSIIHRDDMVVKK
ncbi:MAG: glutamate 5-kinase [Candidatus Marinimicrobia bacterium]|nr:glutamate 5-kinase [Candidatus Neomarinimicrobiota bacterium]